MIVNHRENGTMRNGLNGLRRLIREEIARSLLVEVACPVCGVEGAYVGLHKVECANPSCKFYVPYHGGGEVKKRTRAQATPGTPINSVDELEDKCPEAFDAWVDYVTGDTGYEDQSLEELFSNETFWVNNDGELCQADVWTDSDEYLVWEWEPEPNDEGNDEGAWRSRKI